MTLGPISAHPRLWTAGLLGLALTSLWSGFEVLTGSQWLADSIRSALIDEISAATGAPVSAGRLEPLEERLAFRLSDLVIGSAESPGGAPMVVVPEAEAKLGWTTFLGGSVVLDRLQVTGMTMDLAALGDAGWTVGARDRTSKLTIREFQLAGAEIAWNGQPLTAEFSGSQLSAEMWLEPDLNRYRVEASLSDPQWGRSPDAGLAQGSVTLSAVGDPSRIEITRATVRTSAFEVEGACLITGWRAPHADCRYSVTAGIEEAAAMAGLGAPDLTGLLNAAGELEWDWASGSLRYWGDARAAAAPNSWPQAELALSASYNGTAEELRLEALRGTLLRGRIDGAASLAGAWAEPRIEATFILTGMEIEALTSAAGMDALPWSGLADLEATIRGAGRESPHTSWNVTLRPGETHTDFSVSGHGSGLHSGSDGRLEIASLRLASPLLELDLNGALDADGGADLTARARLPSAEAVRRIVSAVYPQASLPEAVPDGRYTFRGTVRGPLGSPSKATLNGTLAIDDFLLGGREWRRMVVDGSITERGLEVRRGLLNDGRGRLDLSGTIPWRTGGQLNLSLLAESMDAAKLSAASGFGLPIAGALSMQMRLSGTLEEPQATSTLRVEAPSFFGERFDHLAAELTYDADGFQLRQGALSRGSSELRAAAKVSPGSGRFEVDLSSNRWPLQEFEAIREAAPGLTGEARFQVRGSGTTGESELLGALRMQGNWEVSDLRRDGVDLGHWRGDLQSGQNLDSVELDLRGDLLDGAVLGSATYWHAEPERYSGVIRYTDLSVGRLLAAMDLPGAEVEASVSGQADFEGRQSDAEGFHVNGSVDRASIRLPGASEGAPAISNRGPLRWRLQDRQLHLDSMRLAGAGAEVEVSGTASLVGEKQLDLSVDAEIDLQILNEFAEILQAEGKASAALRARGTAAEPLLEGALRIDDGAIRGPDLPFRLHSLRGELQVDSGQARIVELTGESGGGTIRFGGGMALRRSGVEYRLSAEVDDWRVSVPTTINSVVEGEFTLAGAGMQSVLNGDVSLTRLSTAADLSFAELFASMEPAPARPESIELLREMQLNVRVRGTSKIPVETALVRDMEAEFDLNVVGTGANPAMVGTIGILNGELRMLGTHYTITRGEVRFVNSLQTEAVLDMELETRIRDVDIALVLSGPAQNPGVSYRSDPPLPFHDLVNLVAVGKEPTRDPSVASQQRIAQQSLVQTGADNLLNQALSRPVSRRLQRFFGVSRLKVDPQIGGLEANPAARISTEQQITDDITLTYSYDLSSAQQQAIRIEWSPNRQWSVIVTRDQNGLVGSDILYKVRLP